ncbi:MAG: IclR family transcriptional regulator [Aquificae bacterium]|nr:IclR family transcriptional regulator [Aquificota bacterium]
MQHAHKEIYIIQNVHLALDILFLIERRPISFEKIQENLKINKTKLQKLLNFLREREWIFYDEENRVYRLGIKSFELGIAYLKHLNIKKVARPILREISKKVKENTYLTTRVAYEVLYIEKSEVDREVRILSRYGRVLPLYASASGKIYLSHFDPRELEDYFRRVKWVKHTPRTLSREELIRELDRVREEEYAVNLEEYEEEVVSSAAPVYDYAGRVNYTITVVAPSYRMTREDLYGWVKDVLKEASLKLSEKLGYFKV